MHRSPRLLLLAALVLAGAATAQEPRLPGICFGPFRDGEAPGALTPLPSALRADVIAASRVAERLRTYGMAGAAALVPEFCADAEVSCWPGAWISGDRAADDLECELLVHVARRHPDTVDTVLVGNEALLRGDVDESTLWSRIGAVRRALRYPIGTRVDTRVGTAEPWQVWVEHPRLARRIGVVIVHVYPYHDGIDIADAAQHTLDKLDAVRAIADPTPVVLGEFGWPTAGEPRGVAVPSPENAARYLSELLPRLRERDETFFVFEMWDEAWKVNAEGPAGAHWGMFHADGSPKQALTEAIPELGRGASSRPPRRTDPDLHEPGRGSDRLPAVVAKLIPLIEQATGLVFEEPPRVRVADESEWYDIVLWEMPKARDPDRVVAFTFGLFLPDTGEAVLSPFTGYHLTLDDSLDGEDWKPADVAKDARPAWLIVAHELTHILQEQHFRLPSRSRATTDRTRKLLLWALREGHATAVEEHLAVTLWDIDDFPTRYLRRRYGPTDPEMQGLLFIRQVGETQGQAAVHAALGNQPPTPEEFARAVFDALQAQREAARRRRQSSRKVEFAGR